MGEETEQLRREIEATRGDISRDVDALTYKASPSRIVSDRVAIPDGEHLARCIEDGFAAVAALAIG